MEALEQRGTRLIHFFGPSLQRIPRFTPPSCVHSRLGSLNYLRMKWPRLFGHCIANYRLYFGGQIVSSPAHG